MSVVVKSQYDATNEFRVLKGDSLISIIVKPGRNVFNEDVYELLKEHSGFVIAVNRDIITINTAGAIAKKPAKEPDFVYADTLIGTEDGKDVIKDYALGFSIILNKKISKLT